MRVQPHSTEAESSVIGACLCFPKAVPVAVSMLVADDFYNTEFGTIFTAVVGLFHRGRQVDLVTVIEQLGANIDRAGGISKVASLTQDITGWAGTENHCRIIKDKARARAAIMLAHDMAEQCYQGMPTRQVLDSFSTGFIGLSGADKGKPETLAEITPRVMEQIEDVAFNGKSFGIPTGFIDLDRRLSGLSRKDLIVIAARPSMGKTVLGVDIALNVAAQGKRVLVFSLEMGKGQIVARALSNKSSVNGDSIRNGSLNDATWPRLKTARLYLDSLQLTIVDDPALSITEMRSIAKVQHLKNKLDLVLVDYMQLGRAQAQNREREISEISSGLKGMAKDLDIPVIALSQLNRSLESRDDKRPRLSDLRESGSIEQDADVVMFIYRDEVYRPEPDNPNKGIAEIITSKHRNGQIGTDKLLFQGEFSRFMNLERTA
jgi:replicative DNA helicase